jgi:hypothetical protein
MSLLTDAQMASIRALGELGMTVDVTITRMTSYAVDDSNPFGDDDVALASTSVTVKGWLMSHMGREFDEDGSRIVAIHDFTLRVPVGTAIDARDQATIGGVEYTVMETNAEDTWPEWTVCYLKKIT